MTAGADVPDDRQWNPALCRLRHQQNEKDHSGYQHEIDCIQKKLIGAPTAKEITELKDWVTKIDSRMWLILVATLLSFMSATGTLAMMLIKG